MSDVNKLVLGNSPHVRGKATTKRIMIDVLVALAPAALFGILFFGYMALVITVLAVVSAVAAEFAYKLCLKTKLKQIIKEFDYTSAVTGLLVGMNMPPLANWYIPVLASVFAVVVVKMIFGGTGKNLVNPALAGRVFAFLSFGIVAAGGFVSADISKFGSPEVFSGATQLTAMLTENVLPDNLSLFLGTVPGALGETSALLLIIGGIYLCIRRVIDFRFPLIFIGVTGLVAVMLNSFNFAYFLPTILSGGLMLGAIFMATDYTTTPNTKIGNYVYFAALGILTAVMRELCKVEVVSLVILLMNITVPLFDKYIVPKPFGFVPKKKEG